MIKNAIPKRKEKERGRGRRKSGTKDGNETQGDSVAGEKKTPPLHFSPRPTRGEAFNESIKSARSRLRPRRSRCSRTRRRAEETIQEGETGGREMLESKTEELNFHSRQTPP